MRRKFVIFILGIVTSIACTLSATPLSPTLVETMAPTSTDSLPLTGTPLLPSVTGTSSVIPTETPTETSSFTETASPFPSNTAFPPVESLKAQVTADRLSCRYGPGPEYLYLFAFRAGANIELVGRVDAENRNWVLVENKTPCWVSASFIDVQGDILSLPVMYPEE